MLTIQRPIFDFLNSVVNEIGFSARATHEIYGYNDEEGYIRRMLVTVISELFHPSQTVNLFTIHSTTLSFREITWLRRVISK
jgi:hypothetical protein